MKHNVYFEGNVQSLGVNTEDGYATVGVITPGQYTFFAESEEHVTSVSGQLRVKLPNQDWLCLESSAQQHSAMPPDVRKRSALPSTGSNEFGATPRKTGRSPKFNTELAGRPEAFRASDGTAAPLKEFLGKAIGIGTLFAAVRNTSCPRERQLLRAPNR